MKLEENQPSFLKRFKRPLIIIAVAILLIGGDG